MAKAKAKSVTKKPTSTPLSVPSHGATTSADDFLDDLAAETTVKKPTTSKPKRLEMILDEQTADEFSAWAAVNSLFNLMDKHNKTKKGSLNQRLSSLWADLLWAGKCQPENPALKSLNEEGKVDCEGVFIVQTGSKIKLNLPPTDEETENLDPSITAREVFVDQGMGSKEAEELVSNELIYEKNMVLRSLTALSTSEEEVDKALYAKLRNFIKNELTKEERMSFVSTEVEFSVRDGFLDRVCQYVKNCEQLKMVLSIIKPVMYAKSAKFAVSDSEFGRTNRLLTCAKSILGIIEREKE